MNQFTKQPQKAPKPRRTGYTMSGTYISNPAKAEAWRQRWELEFRKQRWTERDGKFYPRER
jgi:hypothetical protein